MTKKLSYRFAGYTEVWEEKKLGETETLFTDGNYGEAYPSEKDLTTSENGVPFLRGSNLVNGVLDETNANYITHEKHEELTSGHIELDDIILAVRGSLGAIGYAKDENVGWNINSQLAIIRTNKNEAKGDFLLQFFISTKGQRELLSRNTGTALKQLPLKQLKDIPVPLPSLPEQTAIGSFFQDIDQLISLQQRKLEVLKEQKKTYLKLLFPAKGQTKPALRFAGFEDDWKEVKLGEVATITMGQSPNSENYTDNPNDYILVQGNADMKNGRVFPRVWTTQITKQAKQGNLILSVRAPVGDIGKTDYDVVLGRGVASIDGNEFLYQVLSQMKQNGYWSKLSTGSTFESINSNDIKSAIISLPSLPEQEVIGSFFQDLDKAIAKQEEKVNQLKESKQTLLRKMFI
ncbi:restriction endonuclease subunit S [Streptococcus pseudopneumoniae]|uniref:restriction endonuclease subunit S n=1 Tax=Streptococcus pseudopneumoniae TaxID=257758 RepID=UPI000E74B69E|nr:restriction endonuclease subunit S [Streptococcus pseudopneumoniae]RJP09451.1 restriction endonuclease subunit S [Streptococcus pseudopneumoniae]